MPQLLPLLQANIDLNQVQNQVKAMVLNWFVLEKQLVELLMTRIPQGRSHRPPS